MLHFTKIGSNECSCGNNIQYVETKDGRQIDKWHTAGPKCDTDTSENKLLELIKETLPKLDLPITVGWTGYIDLLKHISEHPNGWCFDECGRSVFIYNNKLYFQRYENGGPLMQGFLSKRIFSDITSEDEINNMITSLTQ